MDVSKLWIQVCIVPEEKLGVDPIDPTTLDGKTELEPVVDADLDRFAEFYAKALGNGNLSKFERAAIKTYLHWKTHETE